MKINKVLALVIGVVLLLALCAGVSLLVVNNTNNHNLAVEQAAATASHNRAVASASAAANAKAIAAANAKAARAEADAKAARAAARDPAPVPGAVTPPAQQVPAGGASQPLANAAAVVTQYYQDLSNGDYADAWTLGGVNIAGADYSTWVAGYATTTSVTLDTESQWSSTSVSADITATQSDGGSTSYQGTYTVEGGVITSADITQTG
jgi:hypothetical protein